MAVDDRELSDEQVFSLFKQETSAYSAESLSDLASERSEALERYLGEPLGDESEGRSSLQTREVYDIVESVMPALMRIFCAEDNVITFEPVGPEDEQQAAIETELCRHVFFEQNNGYYNLYASAKDGLLTKTGLLQMWYDDSESIEKESYTGLTPVELASLLQDEDAEREVKEFEQNPDGTLDITFTTTWDKGQIRIVPVPPEEMGVNDDSRSPLAQEQEFIWSKRLIPAWKLVDMGYEPEFIETLPYDDTVYDEEELARRNYSNETNQLGDAPHWSMRRIWVTEAYGRLDRDGDGIAELLKVTSAGGTDEDMGSTLMDVEEIDRLPFHSWAPIILPHKFYGLALTDAVMDIQAANTALLRGVLDNAYIANNGRTVVNTSFIDIDDLLTSRPDQIVRFEDDSGQINPQQVVQQLPANALPLGTFEVMQYMDELKNRRTGAGEDAMTLDSAALANIKTGVYALAHDKAAAKIETIARNYAELMLRPLFYHMHELLRKHVDRKLTIKLNGEYLQTNPADWKERADVKVRVGVGNASREKKIMSLESLMEKQLAVAERTPPGQVFSVMKGYQALKDWTKAMDLEPSLYWEDPAKFQPPPPQPDPMMQAQLQLLQAQAGELTAKAQATMLNAQAEQAKFQIETSMKQAENEYKLRQEQLKTQVAQMKAQADIAKAETDAEKAAREYAVAGLEREMEVVQSELDRKLKYYEAQLKAAIEIAKMESQEDIVEFQAAHDMVKQEAPRNEESSDE